MKTFRLKVSRFFPRLGPFRAIALRIPTVHHFTRNMHAQIRERKISCSFFSARKKNWHHHVNGFSDQPFISLACSQARNLKKYFPYN